MSNYKSQAHLLDAGNGKFSALGFSHLVTKTGIINRNHRYRSTGATLLAILRVAVTTKGKLLHFLNTTNSILFHTRSKPIRKNLNYTLFP